MADINIMAFTKIVQRRKKIVQSFYRDLQINGHYNINIMPKDNINM